MFRVACILPISVDLHHWYDKPYRIVFILFMLNLNSEKRQEKGRRRTSLLLEQPNTYSYLKKKTRWSLMTDFQPYMQTRPHTHTHRVHNFALFNIKDLKHHLGNSTTTKFTLNNLHLQGSGDVTEQITFTFIS